MPASSSLSRTFLNGDRKLFKRVSSVHTSIFFLDSLVFSMNVHIILSILLPIREAELLEVGVVFAKCISFENLDEGFEA